MVTLVKMALCLGIVYSAPGLMSYFFEKGPLPGSFIVLIFGLFNTVENRLTNVLGI